MPIRPPNRIVKIACGTCGWHLIVNRGGVGDCLVGHNAWKFAVNQIGEVCPKCRVGALKDIPASFWERVSPVEYLRKLHYVFFSRGKGKRWGSC